MAKVIGGQAVMEGVMMKSDSFMAIAVRKGRKIIVKKERLKEKPAIWKKPLLRGIYALYDTLAIGLYALSWSAEQATGKKEKLSKFEMAATIIFSLALTVLIFIALPFYATKLLNLSGIVFNLVDGLIRIAVFVAYILIISQFRDIAAFFQYHGAEHKAVHCYENRKKLIVKNASPYPVMHPRCGTSFLIIVLVISILVFSLIPSGSWVMSLLSRVVLLPLIVSLAYEILKVSAKYEKSLFFCAIAWPGLMIQHLTAKEPTAEQLEVGLRALEEVLKMENVNTINRI